MFPITVKNLFITGRDWTLPQPVEDANGDRLDLTSHTITALVEAPDGTVLALITATNRSQTGTDVGMTDILIASESNADLPGTWKMQVFIGDEPLAYYSFRAYSLIA